jgi:hypothetical protein
MVITKSKERREQAADDLRADVSRGALLSFGQSVPPDGESQIEDRRVQVASPRCARSLVGPS